MNFRLSVTDRLITSPLGEAEAEGSCIQGQPGLQSVTLSQKQQQSFFFFFKISYHVTESSEA